MRRETSQAGNRARKTCRRFRRGEHAGELGAGPPEVLRAGDRHAHSFELRVHKPAAGCKPPQVRMDTARVRNQLLLHWDLGHEAAPGQNPPTTPCCPIEILVDNLHNTDDRCRTAELTWRQAAKDRRAVDVGAGISRPGARARVVHILPSTQVATGTLSQTQQLRTFLPPQMRTASANENSLPSWSFLTIDLPLVSD